MAVGAGGVKTIHQPVFEGQDGLDLKEVGDQCFCPADALALGQVLYRGHHEIDACQRDQPAQALLDLVGALASLRPIGSQQRQRGHRAGDDARVNDADISLGKMLGRLAVNIVGFAEGAGRGQADHRLAAFGQRAHCGDKFADRRRLAERDLRRGAQEINKSSRIEVQPLAVHLARKTDRLRHDHDAPALPGLRGDARSAVGENVNHGTIII